RGHVCSDVAVWADAAQDSFPGVPVAVHKAGDQDGIGSIDHFTRSLEIGADRRDLLSLDQDVAFDQVSHLGVHADDRSAFQQNTAVGIRRRHTLHNAVFLAALRTLGGSLLTRSHRQSGQSGADLEEIAARLILVHGAPSYLGAGMSLDATRR